MAIFQIICLCLSLVSIPAAIIIAKSLGTYLNPVNKKCVPQAVAGELERRQAEKLVAAHLS